MTVALLTPLYFFIGISIDSGKLNALADFLGTGE